MKISVRELTLTALFAALTAAGAFIRIPVYPISFTLQTFFVFLAGICLRPRAAFFSQLLYVAIGLIGIPVFTNGGGPQYIFNPSFGYLVAFMIAAPLMSIVWHKYIFEQKKSVIFGIYATLIVAGIGALGAIYMLLISRVYLGIDMPLEKAIYVFLTYLPIDIIKLVLAVVLSMSLKKRIPYLS